MAAKLAGKRVFLNLPDGVRVMIKHQLEGVYNPKPDANETKPPMLSFRNKMTAKSAFSFLHQLSHIRGRAFEHFKTCTYFYGDYYMSDSSAVINPEIFECFRSDPLDIRCKHYEMGGLPGAQMKWILCKMITPEMLICRCDRSGLLEGEEMRSFFEFIATGKKYCSSLDVRRLDAPDNLLDELISVRIMDIYHLSRLI